MEKEIKVFVCRYLVGKGFKFKEDLVSVVKNGNYYDVNLGFELAPVQWSNLEGYLMVEPSNIPFKIRYFRGKELFFTGEAV